MMRRIVRGAAVAALGGLAACGGGLGEEFPNVLLVTVDTLRADTLAAWGDEVIDTPALDAFLAEALVFENAFATAPITTPSLGSLLTGRMPRNHGALNNAYDLTAAPPTLAMALDDAGYATAAFLPTFLADKAGFKRGFDVYEFPPVGTPTRRAERLVGDALAFLNAAEERGEPWFVWVHLIEPHSPYAPGPELERKALAAAGLSLADVTPRLREETYGEEDDLSAREVEVVRALYRGEVERADRALAPLLERVRDAELATWTLFTADHGEHFHDEHAYVGHSAWLFDAILRVPLAIHASDGAFDAGRRTDPASLLDVAPTLLGAIGLEAAPGDGGIDLMEDRAAADRLLVHETFAPEAFRDKLAMRRGADKLVRIGRGPEAEASGPAELAPLLDAWVEAQADPHAQRRPELDAETRRALEAMGYAQDGD